MPSLSVVVPATDLPPTLTSCLAAIARSDAHAAAHRPTWSRVEVIVVDDRELSATAARNAGLGRATGEVVVFVDADVEVHPDALLRVHDALTADPSLTGVFGAYDDLPTVGTTVSMFRNLLHHHVHVNGAGPAETFWTGLGALRREAVLAVGGFDDQRYPHPSIEDVELGVRLITAGATIRLDPDIRGTHLKRWTLRSMLHTDLLRRGVPWVALLLERRHVPATLNLGWRHRASAAASAVGLLAVAARRPTVVAGSLAAMVGLNHEFYRLLGRRMGGLGALVGVGLHALHHVTAILAVPVGVIAHLRRERPRAELPGG